MKMKRINWVLYAFVIVMFSVSVFGNGLDVKPEDELFNSFQGLSVDWEHTKNTLSKQEFILTVESDTARTVSPIMYLSEYTRDYNELDITNFEVYYMMKTTDYEYYTKWCTDHTYTDCQETQNGSYTVNGGQGQNLIVSYVPSQFPVSASMIQESEEYFKLDLNDMVLSANSPKKYKIVFNKIHKIGDYGIFSFDVGGIEYWDKTHSSDFLVNNIFAYYKFDGNDSDVTGSYDPISNSANLTTGIINQGYDFDSGEYIRLPNNMLNSEQIGSVAAWINLDTLTEDAGVFALSSTSSTNPAYSIYIDSSISKLRWVFRGDGGSGLAFGKGDTTISTGQDYHIVATSDGSTIKMYVNGEEEILTTDSGSNTGQWFADVGTATHTYAIGASVGTTITKKLDGMIDEVGIWDVALNQDNITMLYNNGLGLQYPFTDTTTPDVNITFKSQSPNNLDFQNIFEGVNITYTITDYNTSFPVYINYTLKDDTTPNTCEVSINGTCTTYPDSVNYTSKVGDDFTFFLDKTKTVPSIYNVEPDLTYNQQGNNFSLDNNNDRLKIKFGDFRNDTPLNIFEIDLISDVDQSLPVFYCNSSYTNGQISLSTLPFGCGVLGQIETTASYNHTHPLYSGVQTVDFAISNGQINNVNVTNISYFIVSGVSSNEMRVRYIPNNTNTIDFSSNQGNTYAPVLGTVDAHLHQYEANENLTYQACAYNETGSVKCSTLEYDGYGALPSFEELPLVAITNPLQGASYTINDDLIITWFGFDGDGDTLTYDLTVNDVVLLDNTLNTSYDIDLSAYSGAVIINVEACEQGSVIRCAEDEVSITVSTTTDAVAAAFNFSWDVDDSSLTPFECPTNFMQLAILIIFGVMSILIYMYGLKLKTDFQRPIYCGIAGFMMIALPFYLVACDLFLAMFLWLIGVSMLFNALTTPYKKTTDRD